MKQPMKTRNGWVGVIGAWFVVSAVHAHAEEWVLDVDYIHEVGTQWVEAYVPPEWQETIDIPSPEEWRQFWRLTGNALQSYELIDLARIRPEVETALSLLKRHEYTEPYAAWLEQRMDYFDMASAVVASYRPAQAKPVARPAPRTPRERPLSPPPAPDKTPIPPAANRAMQNEARKQTNWDTKLANRAAPTRAAAMVPALKRIFEEEGVPTELIWLAEVESSFNPAARSPVGATGLFQFMPATAEEYGLSVAPVDQRLDPHQSARAAARYLRRLYRTFDSWPLALAAYNAGQGRVGRLLRTHNGTRFEDIAPHLPSETQMYVPKVMATVSLREGIDPNALPPPV